MRIVDCDYFVVGSGMSGLMTALHLASAGRVVLVAHLASTEAALLTRFLGKSAWFLPYAALVAAVRELRLAR